MQNILLCVNPALEHRHCVFNRWYSHVGPVFGGKRSSDRACGLQWDEASGQGHRLSEHVGGGDSAKERGQAG